MRKTQSLLLVAVLAVVCGFLGAVGGVAAFQSQLTGPQGPSGLAGPPGEQGPPGIDGSNGLDGDRGPRGRSGKAAKRGAQHLGTSNCAGRSVEVVTDVKIQDDKLELEKDSVCVVD
jgi:Collagen triple helix repeat (20 copies)